MEKELLVRAGRRIGNNKQSVGYLPTINGSKVP